MGGGERVGCHRNRRQGLASPGYEAIRNYVDGQVPTPGTVTRVTLPVLRKSRRSARKSIKQSDRQLPASKPRYTGSLLAEELRIIPSNEHTAERPAALLRSGPLLPNWRCRRHPDTGTSR